MIDDAIGELRPMIGRAGCVSGDRPAAGHPLPPAPPVTRPAPAAAGTSGAAAGVERD